MQAEVGGKVDDGNAAFDEPGCCLQCRRVGNGEKHHIAFVKSRVVMSQEAQIAYAFECGVHIGKARTGKL